MAFVRRNPILCLFILLMALASPSMVAGVFKVILYIVMFFILMMLLGGLYLNYRIKRLRRQAEEQMRGGNGTYTHSTPAQTSARGRGERTPDRTQREKDQ